MVRLDDDDCRLIESGVFLLEIDTSGDIVEAGQGRSVLAPSSGGSSPFLCSLRLYFRDGLAGPATEVYLFHPLLRLGLAVLLQCFEQGKGRNETWRGQAVVEDGGRLRGSFGQRGGTWRRWCHHLGEEQRATFHCIE